MNKSDLTFNTHIVDILKRTVSPVTVTIKDGKIEDLSTAQPEHCEHYMLPGFVDAHVHIESSMLLPAAFAQTAVKHGTLGTVSDPHEIANVLGVKGVEYMLDQAEGIPFSFNFGAPSCVPATTFETAGATITPDDIHKLLKNPKIKYLAEVMNYPGVIHCDPDMMAKIKIAKDLGKPIDGHAPGVTGKDLDAYASHGISTDHECFTYEEAKYKLSKGMKILIREGSAAKNFEALHPLIPNHFNEMMFCSDDKHPDDLEVGHINQLVLRGLKHGYPLMDLLLMACVNPVKHYNLDLGLCQKGDDADFILVDNLEELNVQKSYFKGEMIFNGSETTISLPEPLVVNQFDCQPIEPEILNFKNKFEKIKVIHALDGELITKTKLFQPPNNTENFESDLTEDILKIVVINRYKPSKPAVAFIHGFGLKQGAIASSVAHDSHNIIAVGTNDKALTKVINEVIKNTGGIATFDESTTISMPLPIAGLISTFDCQTTAKKYKALDSSAKKMGSSLKAPFMTLSFMALLVIPEIKLSDLGLFDGLNFKFIP